MHYKFLYVNILNRSFEKYLSNHCFLREFRISFLSGNALCANKGKLNSDSSEKKLIAIRTTNENILSKY